MSETEFWRLWPAAYFALYERWEIQEDHKDFMLAQVCSVIANVFKGKKGKPLKASDFMRFRRPQKDKKQKSRQTAEEQMALAKAITLAYGGTVKQRTKK